MIVLNYVAEHVPLPLPNPIAVVWCSAWTCTIVFCMTSSQPLPFLLGNLDGEHVDHLFSQFFSTIFLPPLVAEPYSLKLYSSSAFYVYSSLLDELLLVEVLRTELVVGDYDFILPVFVAGGILLCGTACNLMHPLVLQWQSLGSKPSSHADSLCYSPFNKSFAVTPPVYKSMILSHTLCQMTVVMLL